MTRLPLHLALALIAAGCARAPRAPFSEPGPGAPVWPPPPEQARVVHVANITRHQDLFTEGGFLARLVNVVGGPEDSTLVRPYAMAVHPGGGLLVADPGARVVHWFNWKERDYKALGRETDQGLPSPVGVAVTADGTILVTDSRLARVEAFSPKGRHKGTFAPDAGFLRPAGIAVSPVTNEVFVADVLSHTIVVLDDDGNRIRTIGSNGTAPGLFNFPTHLALTEAGELLVADSMNFRIQRLATDGTPIAAFGSPGNAEGNFAHPKGVAPLAPNVFAAIEGLYDALIFFDGAGNLLMTMGGPGSGPGEFWLPAGIAVDQDNQLLFVADSYNSRIQVFALHLPPTPEAVP